MQYKVIGMSCAACKARVEKAISTVSGVSECNVNLLTNTVSVKGKFNEPELVKAVENAGYKIELKKEEDTTEKELTSLKKRLWSSLAFLVVLMYFSMGTMLWDLPVPAFLEHNHFGMGALQLVLTAVIMVINKRFFTSGFKALFHRSPNMDTLVALGSSAAFIYSTCVMFTAKNAHDFYFESAAMILTLITVGKMLEMRSKGKTTSAIKSLMELSPKTVTVIRDGKELVISVSEVNVGDIFVVKPGESIGTDGVVLEGSGAVDESMLTGESIPVDKAEGDKVFAATINKSGFLKCRVTRIGEDTTLSQIIKMVEEASSSKAPIAKIADKVSGVFVPVVIVLSIITTLIWLITGSSIGFALARGISVLVISCPCALGLATPVAIMVGSGVGAKNGILFKTAVSLENAGRVSVIALDKTGTITKGEPTVTDIINYGAEGEGKLLEYAYSIEKKSEHPLAKAIVKKAEEDGCAFLETEGFEAVSGSGIMATLGGKKLLAGSFAYISKHIEISPEQEKTVKKLATDGKTPLLFSLEDSLLGIIAVSDTLKEDSKEAIARLKKMGIRTVMLTGDNSLTANSIGKMAGVDEIISDVLPNQKEEAIRKIKGKGTVAMVGDGINDAPALTAADVGIAVGAGADVAIDAADVVLMNSSLMGVSSAIYLSRKTIKNIRENLFWAFIYNVVGIPLAAGVLIKPLGLSLSPMFAAAAMSLSSFCVVTNALRLNYVKIKNVKENKAMKKTMIIEGIMCPHCESRVKTALEALAEVESADVNHKTGEAVVSLSSEISAETLTEAVEKEGYKVIEVK